MWYKGREIRRCENGVCNDCESWYWSNGRSRAHLSVMVRWETVADFRFYGVFALHPIFWAINKYNHKQRECDGDVSAWRTGKRATLLLRGFWVRMRVVTPDTWKNTDTGHKTLVRMHRGNTEIERPTKLNGRIYSFLWLLEWRVSFFFVFFENVLVWPIDQSINMRHSVYPVYRQTHDPGNNLCNLPMYDRKLGF